MQANCDVSILLKDKDWEKSNTGLGVHNRVLIGAPHSKISRGELAVKIPDAQRVTHRDGQEAHNYRTVYTDQEATFRSTIEANEVAPLSEMESLLLAGIKSKEDRYDTFIANKLDWGTKLKTDDFVQISLSGATHKATAAICFVGPIKSLPGLTFGVKIVDPHYYGRGTTDGTFKNERYFTCRDNDGLFVSFEKLSEVPGGNVHVVPDPRGPQPAQQPVSLPAGQYRFKIGDRVVIFNKNEVAIHGTVKWAGKYGLQDEKMRRFTVAALGIETDVKVLRKEMESCLPLKNHCFSVGKDKGQVFVREEEAMMERDFGPMTRQQHVHVHVGGTLLPRSEQGEKLQPPPQPFNPRQQKLQQRSPSPHQVRQEVRQDPRRHTFSHTRGDPLNVKDSRKLAKQMGESDHIHFMRQQSELLQKAAKEKKKVKKGKELEEVWQAIGPGESLQVDEQERLLRQFSEGKRQEEPISGRPPPSMRCASQQMNQLHPQDQPRQTTSQGLEVGSPVQAHDHSFRGVIRWTGTLQEAKGLIAGVELDSPMDECGDGEWKGHRYFVTLPGRAFFCPATTLLPSTQSSNCNPLQTSGWEEHDQTIATDQIAKYIGDRRGIQGHQSSSHIDATIFGLFALSDVFDSLFLDSDVREPQREISEMLWHGIVNPLRKNGAVRFESVMWLRNKLDKLGKMEGVNTAENDPEEFLNTLFKHTLHVKPFIHIKRPFGTEPEFVVQLFVEFDESLKTPTVEILLHRMFREQHISFANVPSKLLVQVPRYGKQFQTFMRIIPGLKFNPAPLLESPYTCNVCGGPAWNRCSSCGKEGNVFFCDTCSERVHSHKARRDHTPEKCEHIERGELELLSVLCIETSHYVCFTRDSEGRWLFFDNMANRLYDQYNIPCGVDCTAQLNEWVYGGSTEKLMATGPRDLPELVRRFTQDVYMCVYIQPDHGMYGESSYTPLASSDKLLTTESHREQKLKKEVKQLQDCLAAQSLEAATHEQKLQQEQQTLREEHQRQTEEMQGVHQQHIDRLTQQMTQQQDRLQQLQWQLEQEQERSRQLQERLSTSASEREQVQPATRLLMDIQFKTVSRNEVTIGEHIGKGAWGVVAKGKVGHQSVAVKWPHPDLLKQFPNIINRLRREVAIMAQVRHPNLVCFIAAVFDEEAEQLQKSPMIITELLDINLRSAYQEGRVQTDGKVYLTILRDVAYALHHLHGLQQPIIHRDISAPNVLLQEQPSGGWLAKVSDFGSANLAKLAHTAGEGAIIYTAPEAFPDTASDAEPSLMTTKIDVYSYGKVACELIVREIPVPERYQAMLQQVKGKSPAMHSLIVRCTKRNPLDRPTMADILDELS